MVSLDFDMEWFTCLPNHAQQDNRSHQKCGPSVPRPKREGGEYNMHYGCDNWFDDGEKQKVALGIVAKLNRRRLPSAIELANSIMGPDKAYEVRE